MHFWRYMHDFFLHIQGALHSARLSPLPRASPDQHDSKGPTRPGNMSLVLGWESVFQRVAVGTVLTNQKHEFLTLKFNFKRWSQHYPAHCGQRLMMLHSPGGIRPLTGERELDETVLQLGLFWCRSNMCTACLCHFEFVEELKACLEMLCTRSRQSRGRWLQHMGGREKKMPRSCSGLYEDQRAHERWLWKHWVQAGGRGLSALHWQAASLHHTASPAAGSEQG